MAHRLPRATAEDVLRALHRDGWFETRHTGAHAILHHPTKRGRVTVPVHRGKTLKLATVASIIDQAALTVAEFRELL